MTLYELRTVLIQQQKIDKNDVHTFCPCYELEFKFWSTKRGYNDHSHRHNFL